MSVLCLLEPLFFFCCVSHFLYTIHKLIPLNTKKERESNTKLCALKIFENKILYNFGKKISRIYRFRGKTKRNAFSIPLIFRSYKTINSSDFGVATAVDAGVLSTLLGVGGLAFSRSSFSFSSSACSISSRLM